MKPKRWTVEEEEILVQAVTTNPQNLRKCFIAVSASINRSVDAVQWHWYSVTRFTPAGRNAYFLIGERSVYNGKNNTETSEVEPVKNKKIIWRKLLALLRIK